MGSTYIFNGLGIGLFPRLGHVKFGNLEKRLECRVVSDFFAQKLENVVLRVIRLVLTIMTASIATGKTKLLLADNN